MSLRRAALGAAVVLTALLLQTALSALPGPGPELLLLVTLAFAIAEGPASGAGTGFVAGLLADLSADHEVGRLALAYVLAGFLAGLIRTGPDRSRLAVLGAVAAGAVVAVTAYATEGVLLTDPRTTFAAWSGALADTVAGCVLLAPVVVPVVGALVRRLDDEPRW